MALAAYDKAIKSNPQCAEAWNNKGSILYKLNRRDEAIFAYNEATKLNPSYVDAWYNLGGTLSSMGKYDEGIIAFDKALEISPQSPLSQKIWSAKGKAHNDLHQSVEAEAAFAKARELKDQI